MDFRIATEADVEPITETITLAFLNDPVWGPALVRADGATDHLRPFWRLYVEGSMRVGGQYLAHGATAIASWTPPGEHELSDEQEQVLLDLVKETLDPPIYDAMMAIFDRFEAAHPRDVPHAYLGLLATHPNFRGHGIAQQLLAENLKELDARGIPSYLESTNPANDHRYERAGYHRIGTFHSVLDEAPISQMWRDPK